MIERQILQAIDDGVAGGPFAANWDSLRQYCIPQWYEDAKFGIFIHWGVYAVPAFGNEWYPRNMYQQGTPEYEHHLATYGPQNRFGYKDFIPQLTAARYDADAWATLFREAGAKFVVPVAEHHDGFAMYDTALSPWNAVRMGPKRDVLGELARAVRAQGLVFGLSSHRAEHWWYFDGGRQFDSDVNDPRFEDFYSPAQPGPKDLMSLEESKPDEAFLQNWLARTCELVDKYQPQLVWFDWWINNLAFKPYLQQFAAYYYNRGAQWGQGVAINYKYTAYEEGTAVFDIERGQLQGIRPQFWQNDTAVAKNSWGFIEGQAYKTATDLLHDLVDLTSKNGALLLNVGPRPDGTIPNEEQDILREVGRWLALNGEAIYATRPWTTFGEGPTEVAEGAFTDTNRSAFTSRDLRFTTRDNALYAIALGWPADGTLALTNLAKNSAHFPGDIATIELLGHDAPLRWTRDTAQLTVILPDAPPCAHAYVLKITRG